MLNKFVKPSFLESAWKVLSAYEIWGKSEMVGWLFHFFGSFDIEWPQKKHKLQRQW